jgi:hypothetical protein
MSAIAGWDQRFFASTRGQIVVLLCRTKQTVDNLAAALELTDKCSPRPHHSARPGRLKRSACMSAVKLDLLTRGWTV